MSTLDEVMFNDPLIDGHEVQADFNAEIQAEADSGLPQLWMNDRVEGPFSQWLVDIEFGKRQGELDLVKLETVHRIFEIDEPNPEGESPEVVLELDENGFFIPL